MSQVTHAAALAALMALAAAIPAAAESERRAALSATVAFATPEGQPLAEIAPGQAFRIEVALASATGAVPPGTPLLGWLRPMLPGDLPCAETAAAWRATRQGSTGSVDLNRQLLGVANEDGSFGIVDPRRNVGTANLVAAHRFDAPPTAIAAVAGRGAFLMSFAAEGVVREVPVIGEPRVVAAGLDRPGEILQPTPEANLVLERGTGDLLLLGEPDQGGVARRLRLGARAATAGQDAVAALAGDEVLLIAADGSDRARYSAPGAAAAAPVRDGVAWIDGQTLGVGWLDGGALQAIVLPHRYSQLAVAPDGRRLLAFGAGEAEVAIVDLAVGRVVQLVGGYPPVTEVGFLPDTAFLLLGDDSAVGVVDLRLARPGAPPVVGKVALGPPSPPPSSAAVTPRSLLAPLLPEPSLLAVHAGSFTGFIVDATHATSGRPPMEAVALRGGIPQSVAVLDRGLREAEPGRFRAVAALPAPGPFELVVSAGIGQMSFCAPLPVAVAAAGPEADAPGRIQPLAAGDGVRLRLVDAAGAPLADIAGRLAVSALDGNWRAAASLATDGLGLSRQAYDLPAGRALVVTAEIAGGPTLLPLLLEDLP